MQMLVDDSNAVIVRSTIDLGKNLGLTLVAEGVASDVIYDTLTGLGCDIARGFYISRAMLADEIEIWATELCLGRNFGGGWWPRPPHLKSTDGERPAEKRTPS
jgi:predicted signal transduction protein with EAL and GGDEF domain